MQYEIKLLDLPIQPTLSMRETNPVENLPAFFGKAFGGVIAYLQEISEEPGGMPFGKYYNLDMTALDVEAGFPVNQSLPGKDKIIKNEIPAGLYISTIHRGPYDSMEAAYDALTHWAQENGFQPTGIAYEYYLNDPNEGEDVIALTEIRLPVKKK